jgi:hypothetical protein
MDEKSMFTAPNERPNVSRSILPLAALLTFGCANVLGIDEGHVRNTAATGGNTSQATSGALKATGGNLVAAGGTSSTATTTQVDTSTQGGAGGTSVGSDTQLALGGANASGGTAAALSGLGGTWPSSGGTSNAAQSSIGGAASVGTTGASGTAVGTGGATTAATACSPSCTAPQICDNGTCVDCLSTDGPKCSNNAPVVCNAGKWVSQPACFGNKPACSNGHCDAAILIGGILTLGTPQLASTSGVRLIEQRLEYIPTLCSQISIGRTICISGGIRP